MDVILHQALDLDPQFSGTLACIKKAGRAELVRRGCLTPYSIDVLRGKFQACSYWVTLRPRSSMRRSASRQVAGAELALLLSSRAKPLHRLKMDLRGMSDAWMAMLPAGSSRGGATACGRWSGAACGERRVLDCEQLTWLQSLF